MAELPQSEFPDIRVRNLSIRGGSTRRHVARNRQAIHPGRPDLNRRFTVEFRPGWWVGTNYSTRDVERLLGDLSESAGLPRRDAIALLPPSPHSPSP